MAENPKQEDQTPHPDGIPRITWGRLAVALGILLTVALLVALGFLVRWYFTSGLAISERKDLVQGLGSAAQALAVFFTGLVALIGLYFTRRNTDRQLAEARENTEKQLRQARESQEKNQESVQETLRLTEQGQLTERFTRAIEQIGSDKLELKLGGIYALERIARESEEDHGPIMEVLTAYVREHAPWPPKDLLNKPSLWNPKLAYGSEIPEVSRPIYQKHLDKRPSEDDPDIRAMLTVLRRRSRYLGNGEAEPLDLRRTNLRAAKLRGVHLERATLWATNLQAVDLREAHLEEANLAGSDLMIANLWGCHLERANLQSANLQAANLRETHLEGANLYGANMTGAAYEDVHLEGADLSMANMRRFLGGRVYLWGADLSGTNLRAANFTEAVGLTQEQVDQADGDRKTQLPKGLIHPAAWPENTDWQPDGNE